MTSTSSTDPTRRVALVTGCGKSLGIGSATARALARAGHRVVVSDLEPRGVANDNDVELPGAGPWHGLASLVAAIEAAGGDAWSVLGDVSVEADANRMVAEVLARYGRLDILVNNAGAPHGDDRADIEKLSLAAWERVMGINLRGVFLMSRAAVGPMRRQGWGRIVNIASGIVHSPPASRTAYTASKAAVIGFTRALAMDVVEQGITVNAVAPGSVRTARAVSSTRKAGYTDIAAGLRERAKRIPMKRHAEPDEIAAAIAYLASDAAAYVTGTTLDINGAGMPH